jgi:hypothetical protein
MFAGLVPAALMLAILGCGQSEKSLKNTETDTPMELGACESGVDEWQNRNG